MDGDVDWAQGEPPVPLHGFSTAVLCRSDTVKHTYSHANGRFPSRSLYVNLEDCSDLKKFGFDRKPRLSERDHIRY